MWLMVYVCDLCFYVIKVLDGCQMGGKWEVGEKSEGGWEVQISSYEIYHKDVTYNTGNIINNVVIALYGDR